jgi:tRNA (guanosine-2'-O-)-methyltransferase
MTPERIARLRQVLDHRQPDLLVVTDFVHKQRNLSAIVRCCDAVGVMRVDAVIGDEEYQAFRGTAMGSHNWVEVNRHRELAGALAPLRREGFQVVAAHLSPDARDFRSIDYTRPTALLLGAERRGLSAAGQELADCCITIPMVGMVGSLNVSVAAGIILAEAQHQRQRAGLYDHARIDGETYRRLLFEWGHPQLREFCQQRGLAYPPLDDEGEVDRPAAWYASVKAGTAPRREYLVDE